MAAAWAHFLAEDLFIVSCLLVNSYRRDNAASIVARAFLLYHEALLSVVAFAAEIAVLGSFLWQSRRKILLYVYM